MPVLSLNIFLRKGFLAAAGVVTSNLCADASKFVVGNKTLTRPRLQRGCPGFASVTRFLQIKNYHCAMAGDRYFISDQHGTHFLTFTVVEWTDIFTRPVYKQIIVDALNYCTVHKGLEVFAWVLMTNHLHLICRTAPPFHLSHFMRDFKKHTSKKISVSVQEIAESRRDWLLHRFSFAAYSTARARDFKVWTDDNHAVCMEGRVPLFQKVDYIHNNPVRQYIVSEPQHYLHSSAGLYAGNKAGLVKVTVLER